VSAKLYLEGGGDSKEMHARCREGFRRLMESCGLQGRLPRLVACGGREATFGDFQTAQKNNITGDFVAMLVDSEDPVADAEQPWTHLKNRDGWEKPADATDDQALLMTTCMETWIVSDRPALRIHYGAKLKEAALPPLVDMETRNRHEIHDALCKATDECKNGYKKGKRSFEAVAQLTPSELRKHLPSFKRFERVLKAKL
jgi:hypothetical protein